MSYREITVSCYLMTDDPAVAAQAASRLTDIMTGFALEGGVSTVVKVGTCEVDDELIVQMEPPPDEPDM